MKPRVRIWDKERKIMTYPGESADYLCGPDESACFAMHTDGALHLLVRRNEHGISGYDMITKLDPSHFVVMLSSNRRDRDNKEIFEHDIVWDGYGDKYEVVIEHDEFFLWEIGKTKAQFLEKDVNTYPESQMGLPWGDTCRKEYDVLGNRFENKELLRWKNEGNPGCD